MSVPQASRYIEAMQLHACVLTEVGMSAALVTGCTKRCKQGMSCNHVYEIQHLPEGDRHRANEACTA